MALEARGTVSVRGSADTPVDVDVHVDEGRIRLVSAGEVVADWMVGDIGIHSLSRGFSIRAEGEEFLLVTDDDAGLAEEVGIVAVSPRLARQVAARHRPEERPPPPEPEPVPDQVGPIVFALSGAMILVGATLLRTAGADPSLARGRDEVLRGVGIEFWLAFTVTGGLLVAMAYLLAIGALWGRIGVLAVVTTVVLLFGVAVGDTPTDAGHLTAYGFLAGGLAIAVAALFGADLHASS